MSTNQRRVNGLHLHHSCVAGPVYMVIYVKSLAFLAFFCPKITELFLKQMLWIEIKVLRDFSTNLTTCINILELPSFIPSACPFDKCFVCSLSFQVVLTSKLSWRLYVCLSILLRDSCCFYTVLIKPQLEYV